MVFGTRANLFALQLVEIETHEPCVLRARVLIQQILEVQAAPVLVLELVRLQSHQGAIVRHTHE